VNVFENLIRLPYRIMMFLGMDSLSRQYAREDLKWKLVHSNKWEKKTFLNLGKKG
jgi:hypothetical protein